MTCLGLYCYTVLSVLLLIITGAHSQTSSSCYVFGTEHILTFDKQRIDINSYCQFTLAYTCPASVVVPVQFGISIQNAMRDDVSVVQCVQVIYASYTVQLCSNQTAMVDGDQVDSILTANGVLMVYDGTTGIELALQIQGMTEVIIVTMSPSAALRVTVPNTYANKLCGLCGNFDGSAENDLKTADDVFVSNLSLADQGADISRSYIITELDVPGCQSSSDISPFTPDDCSIVPQLAADMNSANFCGAYDTGVSPAFQACIDAEPRLAADFKSICEYDFCANYLTVDNTDGVAHSGCFENGECVYNASLAKQAVNNVAQIFVDECRSRNIDLTSWRSDYMAELTCPGNTLYSFNGDKCPDVCGIGTEERCTPTNQDGCVCAAGLFRDSSSSQCVNRAECGCLDPADGSYHSRGSSWLDSTCSTRFSCASDSSVAMSQIVCSEFASCNNAGSFYECACNAPEYGGDGFACRRQCDVGEQPAADESSCEPCPIGTYQPQANQFECLACGTGNVTLSLGSTQASDCTEIVLVPDSAVLDASGTDTSVLINGYCVDNVYDSIYQTVIPSDVLPDGLPFGFRQYTSLHTSTNGLISFGRPFIGRDPISLGIESPDFKEVIAAVYWFRQDLRRVSEPTQHETRLCMSSYNTIDGNADAGEESRTQTGLIKKMLQSSSRLDGVDFTPTYAFVATWYKSIAFPYVWYDAINYKEYATYQAIVATDGVRTYLMYVYPSGVEYVKLRRLNRFRNIYMGYTASDDIHYFSLYLSKTTEIVGLHTQPTNTAAPGRWAFEVANRGRPNPFAERCLAWYRIRQVFLRFSFFLRLFSIDDCPCNRISAFTDARYYFDFSNHCAYSLGRRRFFSINHRMCCYDRAIGSLLTDPVNSGYSIRFIPILHPFLYELVDKQPYENCCTRSDHCSLFRTFRPATTCDSYRPPRIGSGFGDPHIFTLDGHIYTFNPIGEFWMIKSAQFSAQARMVQSTPNGVNAQATQFQAMAMQSNNGSESSDRIHVELNNNRTDFVVYKNDESLTNQVVDVEALIQFTGGVIRKTNQTITVTFDTGFAFRFLISFSILSVQSLAPSSANGTTQGLLGVFDGDIANDFTNPAGDIVCEPTSTCTEQIIHNQFGESWRINASESIMWYRVGWDSAIYTDTSFVPVFLSELSANSSVMADCNDEPTCVYDTILTNSSDLGRSTSLILGEVYEISQIFNNTPPHVTGPNQINATVNQMVSYVYTYGDADGDDVQLVLVSAPPDATLTMGSNSLMMTWTPANQSVVTLGMYARETQGIEQVASPILEIMFRVAPDCQNGGNASYDMLAPGGSVTPLFYKVLCVCAIGWEGEKCETDIDGCADNPCYMTNCTDVSPEQTEIIGSPFMCAAENCSTGYNNTITDVDECFDIDECVLPDAPCPFDLCINTHGSFICNCATGFAKHGGEGSDCEDINECETNLDNCTDICVNVNGTFECDCYSGGTLNADNITCDRPVALNTLCDGQYNCSYACINDTNTNEVCACPRDQTIDTSDNSSCIAFNECANPADNGCDTSTNAICEDLDNGYRCTCPIGSKISSMGFSCEECTIGTYGEDCLSSCDCRDRARECNNVVGCTDCTDGWEGDQCNNNTNECDAPNVCPNNSQCFDNDGSFECLCDPGFLLRTENSVKTCENINECITSFPCSTNANCTDTPGNYSCDCNEGYVGDGVTCSNINECAFDRSASDYPCVTDNVRCVDMAPGFSCLCDEGYYGDGRPEGIGIGCIDVDECLEAVMICPQNANCVNLNGSYTCVCEEYYTGDGNVECVDIDECETGTDNCDFTLENGQVTCNNLIPMFDCTTSCDGGFIRTILDSNVTCLDQDECSPNPSEACPGGNVACQNKEGSFDCICNAHYEMINGRCEDINECLLANNNNCTGNEQCVNMEPLYECICPVGYTQPDCTKNEDLDFENIEQTLNITYNPEWSISTSEEYHSFVESFRDTVDGLFNITSGYRGINILSVEPGPGGDNTQTRVTYEVVYTDKPVDLEHRVFDTLMSNNYTLYFDGQLVKDLRSLSFGGLELTCSNITCLNNFICIKQPNDYPMCDCSAEFAGYNCGVAIAVNENTPDNLLPLWISAAVAFAMLLIGAAACCFVVAGRYRRRNARRRPQLHRFRRGPAIFNPASRLPTEAYNYQFPTGSVRDSDTMSSSSSGATSRRTQPVGRAGASVPFSPRFPQAYGQLADLDDR